MMFRIFEAGTRKAVTDTWPTRSMRPVRVTPSPITMHPEETVTRYVPASNILNITNIIPQNQAISLLKKPHFDQQHHVAKID